MRIGAALAGMMLAMVATGAQAHPHVWVTAKTEVAHNLFGRITGLNHAWTFDEGFSAYAVQGLDTNKDGKYSREELQPLAEVNVTSLREFGYFTVLKAQGKRAAFDPPKDYWLEHKDGRLVLHFTLPLKAPVEAGSDDVSIDVYDPTFFVSFAFDKDAPVALSGARSGCKADVQRPVEEEPSANAKLSESFFQSLNASSTFGAKFANRITVNCR